MTDKPFDPNKPFRQRNGREAWIYARNGAPPYSLIGAAISSNGCKCTQMWRSNGAYGWSHDENDLINIPEEQPK